ncbi:MAG: S8 family peptidase [Lachnospiraceae bacterium]
MPSEKIENLLNLALDSNMEERDKSLELNVGYDKTEKTWELIVKYHGDLSQAVQDAVRIERLTAGYAIVTIKENLIESFANLEEVEYIEKPKRLFFSLLEGKRASCILPITIRVPSLTGEGILIAVIDSGIDYAHSDFRHADGTTRIVALWDQTIMPMAEKGFYAPPGFEVGTQFTSDQINEALREPTGAGRMKVVPSYDATGHGTAVAGIAAGGGIESGGVYTGVAPKSDLLIVKLGQPDKEGFPRTTELMRALAYVSRTAMALAKPISVNLSFGNTYGSHDGTSLVERYLDNIAEIGRSVICVGSGNEGASAGHVAGRLTERKTVTIELALAPYEIALNVQLWKNYADEFRIYVKAPNGEEIEIFTQTENKQTARIDNTTLLLYNGEPKPYTVNQEIYVDMIPVNTYLASGIWSFRLEPIRIISGEYYFYLPAANVRNTDTRFYRPTPEVTLTIPSTAAKVITVGAYDVMYDAYADFSGRGYVDTRDALTSIGSGGVKPDLVAPGVTIISARAGGGYASYTGTSFATPFVTGGAALLMEWGIERGNDRYLYGEKVKAYLIRGARQLPGFDAFPNPRVGWGALCVGDSLPI